MLKRWFLLALAALCLSMPALAEVYAGTTVALIETAIPLEEGGSVESLSALPGQYVTAGETLLRLKSEKAFATQDGTVSLIAAEEGRRVDGEVLEIAPLERYTLYCTVEDAYASAGSQLLHCGETVYIKCTADGSHRAFGVVTQIDGEEYRVLTLGGELYVGETVYLYRDATFTAAQRLGIGTVVVTDTQTYEAEGRLSRLCVAAGDFVERGQLLYETGGGEVVAPIDGLLTELAAAPGDALSAGQVVARIVPEDGIGVAVQLDESAVSRVQVGDRASLILAGQEEAIPAAVVGISDTPEDGLYTVNLRPEAGQIVALGQTVEVFLTLS